MADKRQISYHHAFAQPAMSTFIRGLGYVSADLPKMPDKTVFPAEVCSPPPDALEGSIHELYTPGKIKIVRMAWKRSIKTWVALTPDSNRLGYLPAYLAAHGWSYKGPC